MKVLTTLKRIGLSICMIIFLYAIITIFQLAHGVFQTSISPDKEKVSEIADVESARFESSDVVKSFIPGLKEND